MDRAGSLLAKILLRQYFYSAPGRQGFIYCQDSILVDDGVFLLYILPG